MKQAHFLTPLAITVAALAGTQQALAGPSGYAPPPEEARRCFIVRAGGSYVDPDDDFSGFLFDGVPVAGFAGSRLELDDEDWGWNISGVWLPVEHWGVELMYTDDFDHDVDLRNFGGFAPGADRVRLGDFDVSMGDLFLNWYPLDAAGMAQPYLGLGVNYTDFDAGRLRDDARDFLFDDLVVLDDNTSVGMGHSWGLAAQAGIDLVFGRDGRFLVNGAIIYRDVELDSIDLHFTDGEGFRRRLSVDDFNYDPWVLNLGVGFRF